MVSCLQVRLQLSNVYKSHSLACECNGQYIVQKTMQHHEDIDKTQMCSSEILPFSVTLVRVCLGAAPTAGLISNTA